MLGVDHRAVFATGFGNDIRQHVFGNDADQLNGDRAQTNLPDDRENTFVDCDNAQLEL